MEEPKILEYISITQPRIEKYAMLQGKFMKALHTKLDTLQKIGGISKEKSDAIMKEAASDPSTIFNHLSLPSYNNYLGTVCNNNTKIDPFVEYCTT